MWKVEIGGGGGGQKMWKVEIGGGGGEGGVKKCGKWKLVGQKLWKVEIGGCWNTPTNDVFYYIIHSFMIS